MRNSNILRTLGGLVLGTACLFSSGCPPENRNFTVKNEFGSIVDRKRDIVKSEGAMFGNDSIKIDSTYGLELIGDDGKTYVFGVRGNSTELETLNYAIKEGTKITLEGGLQNHRGYTINEKTGSVYANSIIITSD